MLLTIYGQSAVKCCTCASVMWIDSDDDRVEQGKGAVTGTVLSALLLAALRAYARSRGHVALSSTGAAAAAGSSGLQRSTQAKRRAAITKVGGIHACVTRLRPTYSEPAPTCTIQRLLGIVHCPTSRYGITHAC
jgi:hypothetical protein